MACWPLGESCRIVSLYLATDMQKHAEHGFAGVSGVHWAAQAKVSELWNRGDFGIRVYAYRREARNRTPGRPPL